MLDPDYIDRAGDMVGAVYGEIEADMLAHLCRLLLDKGAEGLAQRGTTALNLLAQSAAPQLMAFIERHREDANRAVLRTVEDALGRSDRTDLGRMPKDARDAAGRTLPRQVELTAQGVAEIIARDNVDMAQGALSLWNRCVAEAAAKVNTGTETAERAIHQAVRRMMREGISTVAYRDAETGRQTAVNRIDVAVRRHVRTQIVQDAQRMTMARMERLGIDLVEVSSHSDSRPSHAEWQGQCYSLKGEQVIDGVRYPDFYLHCMSGDLGDILGGVNCRHSYGPYRHGAPRMYEPDPQHPSGLPGEEVYELEQGQRYRERKIREAKRELRGARMLYDRDKSDANLAEYLKAKQLLRNRQEKMRAYIDGANAKSKTGKPVLHRKPDREWAGDMPKGGVAVSAASRKRAMERAALKERCLRAKYPVFDRDELGRIGRATQTARKENGRYDVVMHGSPQIALPYLERADARLIADVLRSRDDYHGEPVRLLSCYTGRANERGECFAQRLADELGVTVTAPDGMLWLKDDGGYSIGENEDENTGSMVEYKPRRKH